MRGFRTTVGVFYRDRARATGVRWSETGVFFYTLTKMCLSWLALCALGVTLLATAD